MIGRHFHWLEFVTALFVCVATPARADHVRPVLANGATNLSVAPGQQLRGTAGQAITGHAMTPGVQGSFGFWVVPAQPVSGVEPQRPDDVTMGVARPNPTRGEVRFALMLPKAGAVRLRVFNVSGRLSGQEYTQAMLAGQQELIWSAPPGLTGMMFATVSLDGRRLGSKRFMLLR